MNYLFKCQIFLFPSSTLRSIAVFACSSLSLYFWVQTQLVPSAGRAGDAFCHFHFPVFAVIIYFVIRLNLFVDCGLTNCNQSLWLTDVQYSLFRPSFISAKSVQGIKKKRFYPGRKWKWKPHFIDIWASELDSKDAAAVQE